MKFTKKKLALAIGRCPYNHVSFSQRLQYRQRQESRHY